MMRVLIALLVLVVCCGAHICSMLPPQRGALNIEQPGDPSCYRRTPYCGGVPFGGVKTTYVAGELSVLKFQQNLNHWYEANLGAIEVRFSTTPENNSTWEPLYGQGDMNMRDMVTQTNITFRVIWPEQPIEHGVLIYQYISNNPDEVSPQTGTATFYNCADIQVVAKPSDLPEPREITFASPELVHPTKPVQFVEEQEEEQRLPKDAGKAPACKVPPAFTATAIEQRSLGLVHHTIYYDFPNKMVRWDRVGAVENGDDMTLRTITNYTSLIEYVINPATSSCQLYGPDAMETWAWGSDQEMFHQGTFQGPDNSTLYAFDNGNGKSASWVAMELSPGVCAPYTRTMSPDSSMVFTGFEVGTPPASVFELPSYCDSNAQRPPHAGCGPWKREH